MNIIGLIYKPTGLMLKDDDGNEYEETKPIEGWHVNSTVEIEAFADYAVYPKTPSRVYAGSTSKTFCYTFPDEATFEALHEAGLADEAEAQQYAIADVVTPRQLRLALVKSGVVLSHIDSLIDATPEPEQSVLRISWEHSTEYNSQDPLIQAMAMKMGLTPKQVKSIFTLAKTL